MVSFKELQDDSSRPLNVDLAREVERLRLEVELAHKQMGYLGEQERAALSPDAVLQGFSSPEDFVVQEKTLDYGGGDVYVGECLGNLRHGQGKHTCADGAVYEGAWKYDKRDGKGKVQFKSGLLYEGDWKDDKAHGSGVAQYENGTVYVGEFRADQRCGWGTHYFSEEERYEGEWTQDKMTGKGRLTFADGSYYEGEWLAGERTKGKFVSADGAYEYSGGWKGQARHGYGVMYERGVCKYMGEWREDKQEGEGKCLYADGSAYDGQWKEGKRHGRGKFSSQAAKYEGKWAEGMQCGQGATQYDDGSKYVGEFQGGVRHGKGRCLFGDGSKYEGEWQGDKRHGKGSCLYANGDRYQGEWQNDRRHGFGVCKFADGTKFRGDWEDDGWVQSAADPAKCRVAGPGVVRAVAGQQAEFAIQARDENGNQRLSGGDEFQVLLTGPSALAASVADKGDGTYSVSYTATVAGVYELRITIGADEQVADSPYPLRVLPGRPCPRICEVVGEGRSRAVAGRPAAFEIRVYDEFGNRWFGDGLEQLLPLEVTLECGGQECPISVEARREGQQCSYACTYKALAPGFYRLHVTHGGAPLPRTPFSVQVTAGEQAGSSGGGGGGEGAAGALAAAPLLSAAPIRDEMKVWEEIAALAYGADGVLEGWEDSDRAPKKTAEEKFVEENPGVAVVENLEDMWVVSKLQRDRKAKEEAEKQRKLQEMRSKLEASFGPAQQPDPARQAEELKAIIQEDLMAAGAIPQPLAAASGAAAGPQPGAPPASPAAAGSAGAGLAGGAAGSSCSGGPAAEAGPGAVAGPAAGAAAAAPRLVTKSRLKAAAAALEQLD